VVGSTAATEISDASLRTAGWPSGRGPQTGSTTTGATALAGKPAGAQTFSCELHELDSTDARGNAGTDEEVARFALVLKACERVRAMIVREELAFSNGRDGRMPIAAAVPVEEEVPVPAMVAVA
jgi:hypothetical protein